MNQIKYLLFAALLHIVCYGQDMPNIVPPSPEAASVFKFVEMPVSLYTGLPNVSIPLFEIESGNVTVPISINYHARGVQVAEIAPRVGIGWTLNAGGMVTKQVRDLDDALFAGNCYRFQSYYSDSSVREYYGNYQLEGNTLSCDLIPDQYSFNVNGMSGKFMNDLRGGGIVQQQYSDVKVYSNMLIKDAVGNSYYFGENDKTDNDMVMYNRQVQSNGTYLQTNPDMYTNFANTWHLTRIKTASGPEIKYYYSKETTYYNKRSNDKGYGTTAVSNTSYIRSEQQRLDSITFDKGKVEFEYSQTAREDMPGSYSLLKATLYSKSGQKVRQAIFDYDYTTSTDYSNINNILANDLIAYKRLFLKSVQFVGQDASTLPPYRFEYNETILPSRHSNSVDVWGYYNGKNSGSFLENYYDDRSVDVEKVQAGLLETMIKPEGGRVNFYYEPNIAVNVFPSTVSFGKSNPSYHRVVTLSPIDANPSSIDNDTGSPRYTGHGNYSDMFVVSPYRTSVITASLSGNGIAGCDCGGVQGCTTDTSYTCQFIVSIQQLNPSTNTFSDLFALRPGNRTIVLNPGIYKLKITYIGGGAYTTTGLNSSLSDPNKSFIASVNWYEEMASSFNPELMTISEIPCESENYTGKKIVYAAGNRIKKIEYKDASDAIAASIKTYSYTNPDTGQTSGRILGLTNFVVTTQDTLNTQPANAETDPWGSGGGSPFSTYQGNNVGYKYVTEYYGEGNTTRGKTDYEYSMIYDTGRYYEFPYHPATDNEWLRGKELNRKVYKKVGNSYQLVQKTQNTYLLGDSLEFTSPLMQSICNHPFFKPSVRIPMDQNISSNGGYVKNNRYYTLPHSMSPVRVGTNPNDSNYNVTGYKTYYLTGGTVDLLKTTNTDYLDNGGEFVTTTDYVYDYDHHYNVAEEIRTTSDGTVTTKYFYPQDPEMSGKPHAAELTSKNINIPLVTQSFRDGVKLSEQETVYKKWNDTLLAPEYIKAAKGTADSENRIQYVKIDPTNGNVLQVKKESGINVSYLWGYEGQYPIAMIENAEFDSVLAALGVTEAAVKQMFIAPVNIRTLLPNAMVTTYDYSPLVGVNSVTDPKGYSLYYNYDSFGRLQFVKEKDPDSRNYRILSETKYHYREE